MVAGTRGDGFAHLRPLVIGSGMVIPRCHFPTHAVVLPLLFSKPAIVSRSRAINGLLIPPKTALLQMGSPVVATGENRVSRRSADRR
jgi:hypothetical protein